MLTLHAYREIGGVAGALAGRADELYEALDTDGKVACHQLFLRLVTLGEGTEDTRRRVPRTELEALEIDQPALRRTLDSFGTSRLISFDRDLRTGRPTVEVAHESLLRVWGRLRSWIDAARDDVRMHRRLAVATTEWADGDRDPSFLLRGAHLAQFEDWATTSRIALTVLEREYVDASSGARDALRIAELAEAQRQRRTNRRLRGLLAGVAVFLALALVAGSLALVQRGRARRSALIALSQSLGAQGVLEPRLDRGLLLAREAVNLNVSEQTRSTLLATVLREPQAVGVFYGGDSGRRPLGIALSPDGKTLAVQYNTQDLQLFRTASFTPGANIPFGAGGPPAFSPDGALIAVPSAGTSGKLTGGIDLRDPETGQLVRTLPGDPRFASATGIAVPEVAFSESGDELYALVRDFRGTEVFIPKVVYIARWDITGGQLLGAATNVGDIAASGFGLTGDGRLIVSGNRTTIWDAQTMEHARTLELGGSVAMGVSRDGETMVLGDPDGSVRFVDTSTGHVTQGKGRHTARVQSVGFASDTDVVTTGDDGQILVWDVSSHELMDTFAGHGGSVSAQATDGRTLYTASLDGTIFGWDLSGTRRLGRSFTVGSGNQTPFWGPQPWFALSPDGSTLAVTQGDGYVNLWDLATLRQTETFRAVPRGPLTSVNFSPDGTILAATGEVGQLFLWDLTSSPPTSRRLTGLPPADRYSSVFTAAFSPDGRTLASGDWRQVTPSSTEGELGGQRTEGYLAIWDTESGDLLRGPVHFDGGVSTVVYDPEGTMLAVALADGRLPLVDAHTQKIVRTLLPDTAAPPTTWESFSPDGQTLATSGWSGVVRLWDVASGRPLLHFPAAAGAALSVGFDPSGELLVTSGTDGSTRLWDAATGRQFGVDFPGFDNVWSAATFTPDGSSLVVVYANGHAFVWPATWQAWAARACEVAGRQLTRDEWSAFIPDRPYEPACPADPLS